MNDPNRKLLVDAARVLQPLLGDLVFVGGCATGLLISDPAAADVRPTKDVDAIAEIGRTRSTFSSPIGFVPSDWPRTLVRAHRLAAGARVI